MADDKAKRVEFGHVDMKVMGVQVVLDTRAALSIGDINEDMTRVSAEVGFWITVAASAREEAIQADSFYRQWRARKVKELLRLDPKMAEWKVKAEVEADPKFLELKNAIAKAEAQDVLAAGIVDAFDGKRASLQSRGAMMREGLAATGVTTPKEPRPKRARVVDEDEASDEDSPRVVRDPRAGKMAEGFKKKRTNSDE